MNDLLSIIGMTSVISGIILRGVDYVCNWLSKRNKKNIEIEQEKAKRDEAFKDAMCFLLREQLHASCDEAISNGYRQIHRNEELEKGYKAYRSLGGNGTMEDKWENEYCKLPFNG